MDGVGFSCMTYSSDVQQCDVCRATQTQLASHSPITIISAKDKSHLLQHPEGPLPRIKRIKADTTDQVRDTIQSAFSSIRTHYGGCPLCALDNQTTPHRSYDPETLLKDHRMTRSLFQDLIEELSAVIMGVCHGCGLNLKIVNGIVEHSPARTCIYSALTRLISYEIFISGRLPACIRGMDLGFLNTDDIKSFGNWLKVHPLGESVNNLTHLLYNWVTLGVLQSPAAITDIAHDPAQTQREIMVDQGENETIRQPIIRQRDINFGRTDHPKTRDLVNARSQVGLPASSSLVQGYLGQRENKPVNDKPALEVSRREVIEALSSVPREVSTQQHRSSIEGLRVQGQRTVRVGGETPRTEGGGVISTIAEKWSQFTNIIRTEFHGCSVCAVSKVQMRHGTDDSFNQMLKAHGYHDVNQFMQFERMTYFNQSQAKAICLNCSLPRRLTASMPSHQGRVCPSPRVTRALCYVAWMHRVVSSHVGGIDVSSLDPSKLQSFATWLTTASAGNPGVFNMTHFAVNMMQSNMRY